MTPARRKYHNSISHEEQRIRFLINLCKTHIKTIKRCLNEDDECDKEVLKAEISIWKTSIKNLKKQLPAPKKYYIASNFICCPSCNYVLDTWYNDCYKNYCPDCGQKLR